MPHVPPASQIQSNDPKRGVVGPLVGPATDLATASLQRSAWKRAETACASFCLTIREAGYIIATEGESIKRYETLYTRRLSASL